MIQDKSKKSSFTEDKISRPHSRLSFPKNFVAIDVETTGLNPSADKIIEVACVRYRDWQEKEMYKTLINPLIEVDEKITGITGISNEMVMDAPKFHEVAKDIAAFIGGDIIVGHNVGFDIDFLNAAFTEGYEIENDFVDTLRLAKFHVLADEEHHNLAACCDHYGISKDNHHRAAADCRMSAEILKAMKKDAIARRLPVLGISVIDNCKSAKTDAKQILTFADAIKDSVVKKKHNSRQ